MVRFLVGCAVLIALVGCAGHAVSVKASSLVPAQHPYVEFPGSWKGEDGAIVSEVRVPPRATKPGECLGLIQGFSARDLELKCRFTFPAQASAGVVWRTQESGGVVGGMHALVVSEGGIDLWRLQNGAWITLVRNVTPIEAGYPHSLRVVVRGDKMTAAVDGETMIEASDTLFLKPGGAGLYARNGACRFESVRVERLDVDGR